MERELLNLLELQMSHNPGLKVSFYMDGLRGKRDCPSSFDLIRPLVEKFPSRCSLAMYTTMQMKGIGSKVVPNRFNEGFGLSHMKVYLFDNSLIMTG